MMTKLFLSAGHSEAPKKFSREDEIDNIMCNRIQRILQKENFANIVSVVVPVIVKGVHLDLMGKVRFCNDNKADLVIDIHCNWAGNKEAHGYNIYYNNIDDARDKVLAEKSKKFAECVDEKLKEAGFTAWGQSINSDNNTAPGNLAICSYTQSPALLVELCFLSNINDAHSIENVNYQERFAHALIEGVKNYGQQQGV